MSLTILSLSSGGRGLTSILCFGSDVVCETSNRHVSLQMMSAHLNLPQVDSSQGVKTSQRSSRGKEDSWSSNVPIKVLNTSVVLLNTLQKTSQFRSLFVILEYQ